MSASDLSPFVAAVIQDGIVAEMKEQIEEFQRREENHLKVQITGHGGSPIYGETSLKAGKPAPNDCWSVDTQFYNKACICPFDEGSISQLEIHVGGIRLLKRFLLGGSCFRSALESKNLFDGGNEPFALNFEVVVSKKSPIHSIYARLELAASSYTSMDVKKWFVSWIELFFNPEFPPHGCRLSQLLHHYDKSFNVNHERGGGTKVTLTFERIVFRKKIISGGMSLLDEIGIQTNPPGVPHD